MNALVWALLVYSAVATYALVAVQRQTRDNRSLDKLRSEALELTDPVQRVAALTEVEKLRESTRPWWERSVSTLGVIAFFSMSLAAAVQTVDAGMKAEKVARLSSDMGQLRAEIDSVQESIRASSAVVVGEYDETGELDRSGREVLRNRLASLSRQGVHDRSGLLEEYEISLILGDFERALSALEAVVGLLNDTPADQLVLAEYYYLTGAAGSARRALGNVEPSVSTLPWQLRVRVIVLNVALAGDRDSGQRALASALKVSTEAARIRLDLALARLNLARKSPAVSTSEGSK